MHRIELDYQAGSYRAHGRLPKRPNDDPRYLSTEQIVHLAAILEDIPALLEDLEIAIMKDVRFPTRTVQGDGTEAAIMFNTSASYASQQLRIAITGAAVDLWNQLVGAGIHHHLADPVDAAEWLNASLDRLALVPDAEQTARNVTRAHNRGIRVIEHPRETRYLGECPKCHADLEADETATHIECDCGWAAPIDDVLREALKFGDDLLFTTDELAEAGIQVAGQVLTYERIKKWGQRGRLEPRTKITWWQGKLQSVRAYRLGDVRQLILELERKKPS